MTTKAVRFVQLGFWMPIPGARVVPVDSRVRTLAAWLRRYSPLCARGVDGATNALPGVIGDVTQAVEPSAIERKGVARASLGQVAMVLTPEADQAVLGVVVKLPEPVKSGAEVAAALDKGIAGAWDRLFAMAS